jgi:hypothetical protein
MAQVVEHKCKALSNSSISTTAKVREITVCFYADGKDLVEKKTVMICEKRRQNC